MRLSICDFLEDRERVRGTSIALLRVMNGVTTIFFWIPILVLLPSPRHYNITSVLRIGLYLEPTVT
jgi:hypothetical protein